MSLFSTLLATSIALLARYSGQSDITVPASVALQHLVGAEEVVGYFANMVPVRVGITGELEVRDVLKKIRAPRSRRL